MEMDKKWRVLFGIAIVLNVGVHKSVCNSSGECFNGGDINLEAFEEPKALSSPNYPDNYPRDSFCRWNIYAYYYESDIVIDFLDLDLEDSPDCVNASLTIFGYSRRGKERIDRLCGNSIYGNKTFSVRGTASLVFRTNIQGDGGRGFQLKYYMVFNKYDDSDDYKEKGYIQVWGIIIVIVFVLIIVCLVVTVILTCYCQRRQRARRKNIAELVTSNVTGSDETFQHVQYLGNT